MVGTIYIHCLFRPCCFLFRRVRLIIERSLAVIHAVVTRTLLTAPLACFRRPPSNVKHGYNVCATGEVSTHHAFLASPPPLSTRDTTSLRASSDAFMHRRVNWSRSSVSHVTRPICLWVLSTPPHPGPARSGAVPDYRLFAPFVF